MRSDLRPYMLALLAYCLITVALTYPLVTHLSSRVPNDPVDPLLNIWVIWWNAHSTPLTQAWWDAPSFYPAHGAFALAETLLGLTPITDPVQWCGGSPLIAYNIAFLLSFILSAISAHALVHSLAGRDDAALIAGLAYGFAPYRAGQLSHLQVLCSWWMPLALLGLHRYMSTRNRRWLVLFASCWLFQGMSNGYFALYFSVIVIAWMAWFSVRVRSISSVPSILIAWGIAAIPMVLILLGYRQVHLALGMHRSIQEIQSFSADVTSLFAASPNLSAWGAVVPSTLAETALFPGCALVGLVAVAFLLSRATVPPAPPRLRKLRFGLICLAAIYAVSALLVAIYGPIRTDLLGLRISLTLPEKQLAPAFYLLALAGATTPRLIAAWRRRSEIGFYMLMTGSCWLLSMGPTIEAWGHPVWAGAPYQKLMLLPGFSQVRVPARFGMLAALCLAVAAGLAFSRLVHGSHKHRRLAAGLVSTLIVIEGWTLSLPLCLAPERSPLLEATPGQAPVLELPLRDVEQEAAALYRSMYHRHPLINGYTGFFPPHYLPLRLGLIRHDPEILRVLSSYGPLYVRVEVSRDPGGAITKYVDDYADASLVASTDHERLYLLTATRRQDSQPNSPSVPIANLRVTVDSEHAANLLDHDLTTRWGPAGGQEGGEELMLDLGSVQPVAGTILFLGPYLSEFPRRLAIDVRVSDEEWTRVYAGTAVSQALAGILQSPLEAPVFIPFTASARWIRIRQIGRDPFLTWSVAELRVLAAPTSSDE